MTTELKDRVADVASVQREQQAAVEAAYALLVSDMADGIDRDPNDAAAVLEAVGRDCEQLEADVKRLADRRCWAEQVQRQGPLEEQMQVLTDQIAELQQDRQKALADIDKQVARLRVEHDGILHEHNQLATARRKLLETCPPELIAEEREIRATMGVIGREAQDAGITLKKMRQDRDRIKGLAEHANDLDKSDFHVTAKQREFYRDSVAVQDKNIADMQANMDQWAAESATLLAKLEALEAEKLVP